MNPKENPDLLIRLSANISRKYDYTHEQVDALEYLISNNHGTF